MTDRDIMKQALEALVAAYQGKDKTGQVTEAITALREMLAQPEQEPTGKQHLQVEQPAACRVCGDERGSWAWQCNHCGAFDESPQPRKPPAQPEQDAVLAEREACADLTEQMGICGYGTLAIAAAIRARGQDPMPLFDDWPQFACPPCNHNCNQGRECPNA